MSHSVCTGHEFTTLRNCWTFGTAFSRVQLILEQVMESTSSWPRTGGHFELWQYANWVSGHWSSKTLFQLCRMCFSNRLTIHKVITKVDTAVSSRIGRAIATFLNFWPLFLWLPQIFQYVFHFAFISCNRYGSLSSKKYWLYSYGKLITVEMVSWQLVIKCKKWCLCVQGKNYIIDAGITVVPTPGHTSDDVSLVVQNTANGTVLLAGWFGQS